MTYFRTGNPHYHRRDFVSRSCSGWEGVGPTRYGRQTMTCRRAAACGATHPNWKVKNRSTVLVVIAVRVIRALLWVAPSGTTQCYRIKPHGQLVSVSLTHYCASTPDLSTSWSRTTLQGDQVPGIPNLQTSFPLRCLQRLSLPYLATLRCHWHDNRYTRGTSTPVLSY